MMDRNVNLKIITLCAYCLTISIITILFYFLIIYVIDNCGRGYWGLALMTFAFLLYCATIIVIKKVVICYCRKNKLSYSIYEKLNEILFIGVFLLFFTAGLVLPFFFIKLGCLFCGYISIIAEIILGIICLLSVVIIKYTNLFKSKIIIRRILYGSIYLAVIVLSIGGLFVWFEYMPEIPLRGMEMLLYHIGIRSMDIFLLIGLALYLYISLRSYNAKGRHVLYLRNFVFDKDAVNDNIITQLDEIFEGYVLLRIGNPKTILSINTSVMTFYLPDVNWQLTVSGLIKKVEYCFVVLDISDGVLWEICNHLQYKKKFIYHISSTARMGEVLCKLNSVDENQKEFIKYIELLNKEVVGEKEQSCTFVIFENTIYYHYEYEKIVKFMLTYETSFDENNLFKIKMLKA